MRVELRNINNGTLYTPTGRWALSHTPEKCNLWIQCEYNYPIYTQRWFRKNIIATTIKETKYVLETDLNLMVFFDA